MSRRYGGQEKQPGAMVSNIVGIGAAFFTGGSAYRLTEPYIDSYAYTNYGDDVGLTSVLWAIICPILIYWGAIVLLPVLLRILQRLVQIIILRLFL